MAKVVGLSGSQGGGKSSLLDELEARGHAVDKFRVSRAVQEQLEWESLDRVMESGPLMIQFQEEILKQKFQNDDALREYNTHDIVLVERTFADICSYAAHWAWSLHDKNLMLLSEATDFVRDYTHRCILAQEGCYEGVILLPYMRDQVKWQSDPKRAKYESVEVIYESVERFTQHRAFLAQKKLTVSAKSIKDRADQVETFLGTL